MKKQYILLVVLILNFSHLTAVNGENDTSAPGTENPVPAKQSNDNSQKQKDSTNQSQRYDEIDWNPNTLTNSIPDATVPQLARSLSSYLQAFGQTLSLTSPTYVTLEADIKNLSAQSITAENQAAKRREVDRAIVELLQTTQTDMTAHEKNLQKLLQVITPHMKTLATIANHAQSLKIIDPSLKDQVPAWMKKYYESITQLEKQYKNEISQYRTTMQELGAQLGLGNDMKLAIHSLTNLNDSSNSQKKANNDIKVSSMLAILTSKLETPDTKTAGIIRTMKTIATEATKHNLHPALPALVAARKTLLAQRAKKLSELNELIEVHRQELEENKETEKLLYANMNFYNSPEIEPLSSEEYKNLDNIYVALTKLSIKMPN